MSTQKPHCRPGTTDAMQHLADENEALRAERDELAARVEQLAFLSFRVRDQLIHSDVACLGSGYTPEGQPYPIRDEVIDDITKVLDASPAQSVAHIRAAGAREALERAMQTKNFSDTVVRVDAFQAVIADMESENVKS